VRIVGDNDYRQLTPLNIKCHCYDIKRNLQKVLVLAFREALRAIVPVTRIDKRNDIPGFIAGCHSQRGQRKRKTFNQAARIPRAIGAHIISRFSDKLTNRPVNAVNVRVILQHPRCEPNRTCGTNAPQRHTVAAVKYERLPASNRHLRTVRSCFRAIPRASMQLSSRNVAGSPAAASGDLFTPACRGKCIEEHERVLRCDSVIVQPCPRNEISRNT